MDNILNILKNNLTYLTYEVTYQCNFRCIYCFQNDTKNNYKLITNDTKKLIDIIKNNGCIFLKLTGGEPFTRKDFMDIYQYAYDKNLKLTIGTNASLITDQDIQILKDKKPMCMYISVYAFSNENHDKFTRTKNQLEIVKNNILKLSNAGININLKSVINIYNQNEIYEIKEFADKNKIKYHLYTSIINYPEIYSTNETIQEVITNIGQDQTAKNNNTHCGAGLSSAYISPMGNIYLCPRVKNKNISIFKDGFIERLKEEREKNILIETPCSNCKYNAYGGICNPMYIDDYNSNIENLKVRCITCKSKYSKVGGI